jgi:hypothetical protein
MNIIEAINSGRKYRRKGEELWYESEEDNRDYVFPLGAILADDWEIESTPVTITREDFDAACGRAVQKSDGRNIITSSM